MSWTSSGLLTDTHCTHVRPMAPSLLSLLQQKTWHHLSLTIYSPKHAPSMASCRPPAQLPSVHLFHSLLHLFFLHSVHHLRRPLSPRSVEIHRNVSCKKSHAPKMVSGVFAPHLSALIQTMRSLNRLLRPCSGQRIIHSCLGQNRRRTLMH